MNYYGSRIKEMPQPSGIRRTEIRYCFGIDAAGKIKLKRLVGRSFLEKAAEPADAMPA